MDVSVTTVRNGQQLIIHPVGPPPNAHHFRFGNIAGLRYVYHWLEPGYPLLCWTNSDYHFLADWPSGAVCQCVNDHKLRNTIRMSAACAILRMDFQTGLWVPTVLLLPYKAAVTIAAHDPPTALTVERKERKFSIRPFQQRWSPPEHVCNPAALLTAFASNQVLTTRIRFPPAGQLKGGFLCQDTYQGDI